MKASTITALIIVVSTITCHYPYIFGTSVNTKGIANGQGKTGITGSQTTMHALDDVTQSVAYANGTKESNTRTKGQAIYTPQLEGANTNANANNNGIGNALADSVSKSFNPYKKYYNKYYKGYVEFLNALFMKYPEQRTNIVKILMQYANKMKTMKEDDKKDNKVTISKINNKELKVRIRAALTKKKLLNNGTKSHSNEYPMTIANFNNPKFQAIGQTTFDYQRARGSGNNTNASTNSGNFRWNNATVHKGAAVGNADKGWATSSANNYGLGRVNYVNDEKNAGAYGNNAQTFSNSNYFLKNGAVWNNGNAWGKAAGAADDSLAFSNINGNSYGYGAVNGNTNSYTDGNLSVSKSVIKGAPYAPYINAN